MNRMGQDVAVVTVVFPGPGEQLDDFPDRRARRETVK